MVILKIQTPTLPIIARSSPIRAAPIAPPPSSPKIAPCMQRIVKNSKIIPAINSTRRKSNFLKYL